MPASTNMSPPSARPEHPGTAPADAVGQAGAQAGAPLPLPAVDVKGLSKAFGRPAVDGLDLTIRPGELYALLGPNGAGKTTTLRMIAGLLPPDAGRISIFGVDALARPLAARQITAWLPDEPMIYDKLTPLEYLEFISGLWGVSTDIAVPRAEHLIALLGLGPHADERCEGFSRGMKQKVALAGALIHEPKLIMLDEPLTGLDAASARQVKAILAERVAQGAAIILTTHILEVAERLADRIGIIRQGRLVAEGTLAELHAGRGEQSAAATASLEDLFLELTQAVDEAA